MKSAVILQRYLPDIHIFYKYISVIFENCYHLVYRLRQPLCLHLNRIIISVAHPAGDSVHGCSIARPVSEANALYSSSECIMSSYLVHIYMSHLCYDLLISYILYPAVTFCFPRLTHHVQHRTFLRHTRYFRHRLYSEPFPGESIRQMGCWMPLTQSCSLSTAHSRQI